ncbi:diiron oxygenase [Vitiosangium sp. GDMCC 1.1324]|uniref:diiron oxygenase n=1 Tax=Vitiosangium sp. (strain GDMCC 1.1324) TaxID=2138576 RepID=UPI000D3A4F91|nr:diiron oxygenase [Vitiosangium sp. GDMCC 1.1324]PTL76232.1 hypothetical protein DAT35_50195 [Vitiosangium sp. GDMCC 1.1324]
MRSKLSLIHENAHLNTFHPNQLNWPKVSGTEELDFVSMMAFGETRHHEKAIAYLTKEFAQLAEIERHVSAVMAIVMAELQADGHPLAEGFELHNALSNFAAEELNHANMFYRYVRLLSGRDFRYPDNLFTERVGLYEGSDSPLVKLAALCCSAYIGESVITVFEHRTQAYDPERKFFLSQMLYAHGLDEARHIKTDHYVFDYVIPSLSVQETRRMRQILDATETLNTELAGRFERFTKAQFGIDYTEGNLGHSTQLLLTRMFRQKVFGGSEIHKVDEVLNEADRELIQAFAHAQVVHP